MMQTTKTNAYLKHLAVTLYKASSENKVGVWKRLADDLISPTRQRRLVNVFKLNLYAKDGDVIVVPGKVLGTGDLNRKVTVAAFSFSRSAIEKIRNAKGTAMSIQELIEKNPKAKDVRIFA